MIQNPVTPKCCHPEIGFPGASVRPARGPCVPGSAAASSGAVWGSPKRFNSEKLELGFSSRNQVPVNSALKSFCGKMCFPRPHRPPSLGLRRSPAPTGSDLTSSPREKALLGEPWGGAQRGGRWVGAGVLGLEVQPRVTAELGPLQWGRGGRRSGLWDRTPRGVGGQPRWSRLAMASERGHPGLSVRVVHRTSCTPGGRNGGVCPLLPTPPRPPGAAPPPP